MQDNGHSNVALARELGVTENAVRRMLDLDHASKIEKLEQALSVLGKKLVIDVLAA